MAFPFQVVYLDKVFRDFESFMRNKTGPLGQAHAFHFDEFKKEATAKGSTWYQFMLNMIVEGMLEQCWKYPVIVYHAFSEDVLLIYWASSRHGDPTKFSKTLIDLDSFMEEGQQYLPRLDRIRFCAYWEPPANAVVIWPAGYDLDTQGKRVFDPNDRTDHLTHRAKVRDVGLSINDTDSSYVRVPTEEHGSFVRRGRTYRFINRWGWVTSTHLDLPPQIISQEGQK